MRFESEVRNIIYISLIHNEGRHETIEKFEINKMTKIIVI